MSPPDMFDASKAGRDKFNDEADRQLTVEQKDRIKALEAEKQERLALLAKDHERRGPADLDAARKAVSLEHKKNDFLPGWATTWRTKEKIEDQAKQRVEAQHVKERAAVIASMDKEIDRVSRPDRSKDNENQKAGPSPDTTRPEFDRAGGFERVSAEPEHEVGPSPQTTKPEFDKAGGFERSESERILAEKIQAKWDAERGDRSKETDREG